MKVEITPAVLSGKVTVPASKSAAHRLILCAALAKGTSCIFPACHSNDIDATLQAAVALGAAVEEREGAFYITGLSGRPQNTQPVTVDCGESGSTLRFLLPIAAALGRTVTFVGHGRLPQRPMSDMTNLLRRHGVHCSADLLPITVKGQLQPGVYEIPGSLSSQHLTGLLLAMPLVKGHCKTQLTTPLQSVGYVKMTLQALKQFGITAAESNGSYTSTGCYKAQSAEIEGDWSQASFYLAAAAMGARLQLEGLNPHSLQGDRCGIKTFGLFGVTAQWQKNSLMLTPGPGAEHSQEIDCRNIPDMVPALAAAAMFATAKTIITHAERLRFKESDRIQTTVDAINALGGKAKQTADGLIIYPVRPTGGTVCGANDHRIVMAFSMAAAFSAGSTVLTQAEAIQKSYPNFYKDFKALGGAVHVLNIR